MFNVYRPARLDLRESGTIGQAFKRTSTAKGFLFFNFSSEYLKQLQSSKPLHAKRPLILLLVRITVCMCSNHNLYHRTVLHKCGKGINFSLGCGLKVKNFIIPQSKPKQSRFFYQIKVFRTSRRLGSILHEAAQNFEVVSNIQY